MASWNFLKWWNGNSEERSEESTDSSFDYVPSHYTPIEETSARQQALEVLGLNEKDLEDYWDYKSQDKAALIDKYMQSSSQSFRRFLTKAFMKYKKEKAADGSQWKSKGRSKALKELRRKSLSSLDKEDDVLDLAISVYKLWRFSTDLK